MKKILSLLLIAQVAFGATYYQGSGGDDGNDGTTWALRKLTISAGIGLITTAGDTLFTSGGTIATTVRFALGTSATNFITGINVIGCDASGNELTGNTRAVWAADDEALDTMVTLELTADYFTAKNIEFNGKDSANYCIGNPNSDGLETIRFINCDFKHADVAGLTLRLNDAAVFCHCLIDSNAASGFLNPIATRTAVKMFNSRVFENPTTGVSCGGSINVPNSSFIKSLFYRNGSAVTITNNIRSIVVLESNVFYNNTTHFTPHSSTLVIGCDNIFSTSTTAISATSSDIKHFNFDYNNYYNNTTTININGDVPPGDNNTTGNPNFTSTTAGSEDFLPVSPSALIDSGSVPVEQ